MVKIETSKFLMSKSIELYEDWETDSTFNYEFSSDEEDETLKRECSSSPEEQLEQDETPNRIIINKKPYLKRNITPKEDTIFDKCEMKYSSVTFHHHHKRCLGRQAFQERMEYSKIVKRIKEMRISKHPSSQKSIKRPYIGNECPNCKKKLSKQVYLSHVKFCRNSQSRDVSSVFIRNGLKTKKAKLMKKSSYSWRRDSEISRKMMKMDANMHRERLKLNKEYTYSRKDIIVNYF